MPLLVTSASGVNGNGFGALFAFELDVSCAVPLSMTSAFVDPRGLAVDPKQNMLFLNSGADRVIAISPQGRIIRDTRLIEGLNPGGGAFGPDGRYYVGLRTARTIIALSTTLDANAENVLPRWIIPFPRGFAAGMMAGCFSRQESVPKGKGDNSILAFPPGGDASMRPTRLVSDPQLSPLDLAIAPNGNIVVSSEHPFGATEAVTSVREYDTKDGQLVRVSLPTARRSSANRAACALLLMESSAASLATR